MGADPGTSRAGPERVFLKSSSGAQAVVGGPLQLNTRTRCVVGRTGTGSHGLYRGREERRQGECARQGLGAAASGEAWGGRVTRSGLGIREDVRVAVTPPFSSEPRVVCSHQNSASDFENTVS